MNQTTIRRIPGYSNENVIKRAWFTWIGPVFGVMLPVFLVALALLHLTVPE